MKPKESPKKFTEWILMETGWVSGDGGGEQKRGNGWVSWDGAGELRRGDTEWVSLDEGG